MIERIKNLKKTGKGTYNDTYSTEGYSYKMEKA